PNSERAGASALYSEEFVASACAARSGKNRFLAGFLEPAQGSAPRWEKSRFNGLAQTFGRGIHLRSLFRAPGAKLSFFEISTARSAARELDQRGFAVVVRFLSLVCGRSPTALLLGRIPLRYKHSRGPE